jgi:hypothetical protein
MSKLCEHCGGALECYEGQEYCPDCTAYRPAESLQVLRRHRRSPWRLAYDGADAHAARTVYRRVAWKPGVVAVLIHNGRIVCHSWRSERLITQ